MADFESVEKAILELIDDAYATRNRLKERVRQNQEKLVAVEREIRQLEFTREQHRRRHQDENYQERSRIMDEMDALDERLVRLNKR